MNSATRDPLLSSTLWGDPQLGHLQTGSLERNSGQDILNLLGGGTSASINRGCFISSDMTDAIGVRPLPTGIEFDAASQAAQEIASISLVHTASGLDRHAFIGVLNDGTVPASVTYGSQTPTLIKSEGRLHLYSLMNPDTGPQTVTAVSSIGVTNQVLCVVSRTGVGSVGTAVSTQNIEQPTIFVNISASPEDLVTDYCQMVSLSMAADTSQEERISFDDPGVGYLSVGMSDQPGASSVQMLWSTDATYGDNMLIAVALTPAS